MATSKEFREFVWETLSPIGEITIRPMMGEFLLYCRGVLIGGLYDGRLLVKKTTNNARFGMAEEIPYNGAKPMYMIDIDDGDRARDIALCTYEDLKNKKK